MNIQEDLRPQTVEAKRVKFHFTDGAKRKSHKIPTSTPSQPNKDITDIDFLQMYPLKRPSCPPKFPINSVNHTFWEKESRRGV
jgi:hypothetical protein